ncbi:MAG TPA: tyrosine-type recombinase/integrase [Planctomycetota bacterium]|jgi:integrase/recombinase XerC|nr:tyrosine-type recombinase/integrase [Planctomycetota bacterium]
MEPVRRVGQEPLSLVPTRAPRALEGPGSSLWALIENALLGMKGATRKAYGTDLSGFASWLRAPGVAAAAAQLVALPHGEANALAFEYRSELLQRNLAPATINRHMAALKFVARMARLGGQITWELEVPSLKVEAYRDTAGPGRKSVSDAVTELLTKEDPLSCRNLAIIALLYNQGLRRGEVAALDVEHLDQDRGRLSILGKGRGGREWVTLARGSCGFLSRWLSWRGSGPGPLFWNLDRAAKRGRLSSTSIYRMIRGYGLGRPHGLRHSAITEALEATNGNIREVMMFSRHKDPKVLMKYDDNRKDVAGDIAGRIDLARGQDLNRSKSP